MSRPIRHVQTDHFRLPMPRPLSDALHAGMTHFDLVAVRIGDRDGVEGLGYTYTDGHGGAAIAAMIEHDLGALLEEAETTAPENLTELITRSLHYVGRGGIASFALSAVDIALWDLRAKKARQPLWKHLAGQSPHVGAYASGVDLNFTRNELTDEVRGYLESGFGAIKIKIGREELQEDLHRVAWVRSLLGPDRKLMVDANAGWSLDEALAAACALRPYGVHWLEEPTRPDDVRGHARIAEASGVPLAAGESIRTVAEFRRMLDGGRLAFAQPDVTNIGGITAWLEIARLAEESGIPVTSHGVPELHVHLLAAIPNASLLEMHAFETERFVENPLIVTNGRTVAADRPGHGVRLRWDALAEYRAS